MKINLYKVFALNVLGLFLFSCESEDNTGKANFEPTTGVNVSVAAVGTVASTYTEVSEDTIRVTATLSAVQEKADVVLFATQSGGTATLGEDAEFIDEDGFGLAKKVIPANGGTQVTWTLVINNDCLAEGTETLELQFGDARTANASVTPLEVSFDIVNYTSAIPEITMTWGPDEDGEEIVFGYGSNAQEVHDIDLDLLLYDGSGALISNFGAATGSNPEVLDFAAADGSALPDGDYLLYVDIYDTWVTGDDFDAVGYPVFFDFVRCGAALNSTVMVEGFTTDGIGPNEVSGATLFIVTVAGSSITVNDGVADVAEGAIEKIKASVNEIRANK